MSNWLHTEGSELIEETSGKKASQNNSTSGPEAVEAEENEENDRMDNQDKMRKDWARDEIQTTVPAHKNGGKSLVLL